MQNQEPIIEELKPQGETLGNKEIQDEIVQFLETKIKLFKRIDAEIMNELLAEKYDLSINEVKQIINNNNSIFKCSTHYNLKQTALISQQYMK